MTTPIGGIDYDSLGLTAPAPRAKDQLGQEAFLHLMVKQLENQDPFKPMENGEFLGQLAQFGTVSGITDMQQAIQGLGKALQGNQTLQAASLDSREVLVPSREAWLPPEGTLRGAIDVPEDATNLTLEIADLSGTLIGKVPVEIDAQGRSYFEWDGTLADGTTAQPGFFEVRALADVGGKSEHLDVLVSGRVESVSVGGSSGALALTVTGLGVVDFGRVKGIS